MNNTASFSGSFTINKVMVLLLLILFALLFFYSCNDNINTVYIVEKFEGITETGIDSPEPVGNVDPEDWGNTGDWKYSGIFKVYKDSIKINPPSVDGLPNLPNEYIFRPAYPNPSSGSVALSFTLPVYSEVFVAVIDEKYHVLKKVFSETLNRGAYVVHIETKGFRDGIYRVIYHVADKDKGKLGIYQGFGDVKINN